VSGTTGHRKTLAGHATLSRLDQVTDMSGTIFERAGLFLYMRQIKHLPCRRDNGTTAGHIEFCPTTMHGTSSAPPFNRGRDCPGSVRFGVGRRSRRRKTYFLRTSAQNGRCSLRRPSATWSPALVSPGRPSAARGRRARSCAVAGIRLIVSFRPRVACRRNATELLKNGSASPERRPAVVLRVSAVSAARVVR